MRDKGISQNFSIVKALDYKFKEFLSFALGHTLEHETIPPPMVDNISKLCSGSTKQVLLWAARTEL